MNDAMKKYIFLAVLTTTSLTATTADLFPTGKLSINLAECQYTKAIGDSERLSSDSFSMLKNSRFTEKGNFWKSKDILFETGKAILKNGSEIGSNAEIAKTAKNTRYEAQVNLQGSGSIEIMVSCHDKSGNLTRPVKRQKFTLNGKNQNLKSQFLAFPGTCRIELQVRQINGNSVLTRADVISMQNLKWISARCMPAAITDNVFAVMENNPLPINFPCRTARPGKENIPAELDIVLDMPEGFTLKTGIVMSKISEERKDGRVLWRFRNSNPAAVISPGDYRPHQALSFLISTMKKASSTLYPATYRLEYAGVKTKDYPLNLKVIPGYSGRQPKIFRTGFIPSQECAYRKGNGMEDFVNSVERLGFNMTHNDTHGNWKDFSDVFAAKNFHRTITDYWFQNGYCLGYGDMPDDCKFTLKNGKPLVSNSWHRHLCPTAGYTRSEFFNKNVIGYIGEKIVKNNFGSFIKVNWEPYMYDDKGCFCNRCQEEFIKYSKLPRETILNAWPEKMTTQYRQVWIKFRAWQHGKLIEAIVDGMRELSQKYNRKFVFCPEIGIGDIGRKSRFYDQYTVCEYIDKLDWLEPWGPYIFHNARAPYQYNIGINYGTYYMAEEVKKDVKKLCKNGKEPKLEAFPHGYQCTTWVTEPEAIAYETAAFFVKGWEASSVYVFPAGLDGRYWRSMGMMNNAISCVDEFVFQGKRTDKAVITPVSPVPNLMAIFDQNNPSLAKVADELRQKSVVTLDAFEKNNKYMIALGNAWQCGEAFVKVCIKGLDKKRKYAVYVPSRKVTLAKDYTVAELEAGILIHTGLLSFTFYVVEPVEENKDYGTVAGKDYLAKLLEKRMPAIRKQYEKDKKYASEFTCAPTYDFGQAPMLSAGEVVVKPKSSLTDSVLLIRTPAYTCDLNMGMGGSIGNLSFGGKMLVSGSDLMFRDGASAPLPWLQNSSCTFSGWEGTDQGATITLTYTTGAREPRELRGLQIIKKFLFGKENIKLTVQLKNISNKPITFAYRSHNMPTLFDRNGKAGLDKEELRREKFDVFHSFTDTQKNLFGSKSGIKCRGNNAVFTGKAGRLNLLWDMPEFFGIYRWDSPTAKTSSFELTGNIITLPKQGTVTYTFIINGKEK